MAARAMKAGQTTEVQRRQGTPFLWVPARTQDGTAGRIGPQAETTLGAEPGFPTVRLRGGYTVSTRGSLSARIGRSRSVTVVPRPSTELTSTSPPISSTIFLIMAMPRP